MANNNNGFFANVAVIIYENAGSDKSRVLSDNKGKAGIYMWTHKESGKIYIGSATDLSKRLNMYFSLSGLKKMDNHISRALLLHTHSVFSLSILKYIDISNLDDDKARILILESEQFYLDLVFFGDEPNTYNILKVAGSSLGFKHTDETKAIMKEAQKSINKTGDKNPRGMLGKTHLVESKTKMSVSKIGEKNPMFGKTPATETIIKISYAKGGGTVFVYDLEGTLVNTFSSARKAAEYFHCTHVTILRYIRNNKLFQNQWILSFSEGPTFSITTKNLPEND